MSRDASVTLAFGDGEHRFRLPIGGLRELQEKTGVGPLRLLMRLRAGDWLVDDAREVLRIGLIHGGLAPVEAGRLVARYADERPAAESVTPAQLVLAAALFGVEDEPVGKTMPAETTSATTGAG